MLFLKGKQFFFKLLETRYGYGIGTIICQKSELEPKLFNSQNRNWKRKK